MMQSKEIDALFMMASEHKTGVNKHPSHYQVETNIEKLRNRILAAGLFVFWTGAMILTGFLLAMNIV